MPLGCRCGSALLAFGWAIAQLARADATSCRVEVDLDPPRAVVGQQVLYRARIYSSDAVDAVEWSHAPAFPGIRVESLPGDPQPANAGGGGQRVRDERRALFAERPGAHRLRAPSLRCLSRGGGLEVAEVPEALLEVAALPEEGRPADAADLVGPLTLHVAVTPREVVLGESVRVAVMLRGAGNLWALASPLSDASFASAEVFGARPELVLERGRALSSRRHFVYDVVPRAPGLLHVPSISIAYFDPASGRYRTARSDPVEVAVAQGADAAAGEPPRLPHPAPAGDTSDAGGVRLPAALAGVALAAAVLVFVAWRRSARRGDPVRRALARLAESEALEDPELRAAGLAEALRGALGAIVDDARVVTPEALMARDGLPPPVVGAAHLLASLERARFDPEAPPPDAAAVRRAIADLGTHPPGPRGGGPAGGGVSQGSAGGSR